MNDLTGRPSISVPLDGGRRLFASRFRKDPKKKKKTGSTARQGGASLVGVVALDVGRSYLVDPASSHMLVSKTKPCMSEYKRFCTVKLRMAH